MARPKNPAEALGNDEPTRLFHSPISDDELTLGEGRTMAVAPEDNEALLNELLATSVLGPSTSAPAPQVSAPAPPNRKTGNLRIPVPGKMAVPGRLPARPGTHATSPASAASADGPAAKEGSVRGWSVNLEEQTHDKPREKSREAAHPADSEQHTVAIAQLDAPTLAFKPQGAMREPQKVDAQRMMGTQPLAVYGAPNVHVTQPAAPAVKVVMPSQEATNKTLAASGSGTVKMPPDAASPAQRAIAAINAGNASKPGNAGNAHAMAMAATIAGPPPSNPGNAGASSSQALAAAAPQSSRQVGAQSSGAVQAVPQSAPQAGAQAIPRIVPGAQKMPPLDLPSKRSGGSGFSTLMFTTVACAAVIAAFFAYRARGNLGGAATAPPPQGVPVVVAAGGAGAPVAGGAAQGDRVSVPVIQVAQQPTMVQPGTVGAPGAGPGAGVAPVAAGVAGGAPPGTVAGGAAPVVAGGAPAVAGSVGGSDTTVAAAAPASTETHRKHRVTPPADDGSGTKSSDDAKTADGSGDTKTAKGGKGQKGDATDKTAAPSSTAEEEEMKKATETLSNSL